MEKMLTIQDITNELKACYNEDEFKAKYNVGFDASEEELVSIFNQHCDEFAEVVKYRTLFNEYNETNFVVSTPDGYQMVGELYKKNARPIFTIITESELGMRCSDNHKFETKNGWKFSKDITTDDMILTINGWKKVKAILINNEETVYDFEVLHENHRYWGGDGISSHNTGKSFLACSVCREAQKMGYTPIYLDSEGAIDATFVKRLGVDPSRLIIKQVQTIFETSQFIANLCKGLQEQHDKTGHHDKVIIVLDSLGNLTSEKERDDTMSGSQKADFTKAKDTKALFRVNATPLAKLSIPFVITNHTYDAMSFIPATVQANGSGIVYNASVTLELSAAKLDDKANETAAKQKQGAEQTTKNGILVTAKPIKTRFCRPLKVKFAIPYFASPNPYVGLEAFMTWENSGVMRGNMLTEKEYDKLSDADKKKVAVFEFNGETKYAMQKDTARGIVVKHLGEAVPLTEFYTSRVFTQEYLEYINEHVIHPMFELPDQSSMEDIKELEEMLGMDDGVVTPQTPETPSISI